MKNIFKYIVFGMLVFSRVDACEECIKLLCNVIREYEAKVDPNYVTKTPGIEKYLNYDTGMVEGLRCAIINIQMIHPEAKLSLQDYEKIVNRKIQN